MYRDGKYKHWRWALYVDHMNSARGQEQRGCKVGGRVLILWCDVYKAHLFLPMLVLAIPIHSGSMEKQDTDLDTDTDTDMDSDLNQTCMHVHQAGLWCSYRAMNNPQPGRIVVVVVNDYLTREVSSAI